MPMSWHPEYSVGHPLLDRQHRHLLSLCEKVENYLKLDRAKRSVDEFHQLLGQINESTLQHFDTEEALLEQVGYPGRDDHLDEHTAFLTEMTSLTFRAIQGEIDEEGLHAYLSKWFLHHVLAHDSTYAPYFRNANQPAQQPTAIPTADAHERCEEPQD